MWLFESNRKKHFLYALPIGFIFTILCVFGVASGMEFKDREHGGNFDWLDWLATMLGGLIGQVLQVALVYILISI